MPDLWPNVATILGQWLMPRSELRIAAYYDTPALMVASNTARTTGTYLAAGPHLYRVVAAPAEYDLITAGGVRLVVVTEDLPVVSFDAWNPAKNGYAAASMTPAPDMATITDDVPKLQRAIAAAAGRRLVISPGVYGQNTTIVLPSNVWLDGGSFGVTFAAKDGMVGWQAETANYEAAYANAQTDPNGDFDPLVPVDIRVHGIIFDGARQSYNRSFYRRPLGSGGGVRIYSRQFDMDLRIFNTPDVGLDTYARGGNGPTPLRPGRTKQAKLRVLIDQTGEEGWRHRGPADIVVDAVYQCNAGARLVGQAAGQEDTGRRASTLYGATNGGYTDGIVFDGAGCELMFVHSWGNRAGRGVVQYGGRLLSPLIIAENNHFGGIRFDGGTGVIGIVKAYKNGGWVNDLIGAPTVYNESANVYHNAGLGGETNSHVIGQIQIEDNDTTDALRNGVVHGLQIGPNSRHLMVNGGHVSKRGVIPGHGVKIVAGAAYADIGPVRVHDAIGDTGGGIRSAAVYRAGRGMLRLMAHAVNCDTAYYNADQPTNEDITIFANLNAGQTLRAGNPRGAQPSQRWNISGRLDNIAVSETGGAGIVVTEGIILPPGPDVTVETLAELEAALVDVPANLGRDYVIRVQPGTYGRVTGLVDFNRGSTRLRLQGSYTAENRPTVRGIFADRCVNVSLEYLNIIGNTWDEFGFAGSNGSDGGRGLRMDDARNIRLWGCLVSRWVFCFQARGLRDAELAWNTFREPGVDAFRIFTVSPNAADSVFMHHNIYSMNGPDPIYPDLSIRGLSYANDRRCSIDPRRSDQQWIAGDHTNAPVMNLAGAMVPVSSTQRDGRHPDCCQTSGSITNFRWEDCLFETNNIYGHGSYNNNADDGGWAPAGPLTYRRCLFNTAHNHAMAWQGDFTGGVTLDAVMIRQWSPANYALNIPGRADNPGVMRPGMSTVETVGPINATSECVVYTPRGAAWHDYTRITGGPITQSNTAVPAGWDTTDVANGIVGHGFAPLLPILA